MGHNLVLLPSSVVDAYLKENIDEQFMWEAEVNAGQCHDRLLDAKLCGAVLMEYSGTHVGILATLTETTHLVVLGQLVVDLHQPATVATARTRKQTALNRGLRSD